RRAAPDAEADAVVHFRKAAAPKLRLILNLRHSVCLKRLPGGHAVLEPHRLTAQGLRLLAIAAELLVFGHARLRLLAIAAELLAFGHARLRLLAVAMLLLAQG